ncbi:DUF6767 domain-containing protein [Polymorphospora rubra]|uniref:DUF6767 domain-containing protein n=1 Tax=Polymorphospora rubra TaxID=338584 RepID=UPI0034041F8C
MGTRPKARPEARCPIRPGEPCTLCQLDVTGPQDCGLVYLVMHDDELREGLHRMSAPTPPADAPGTDGRS